MTTNFSKASLQKELESLRQEYAVDLGKQFKEIRCLWEKILLEEENKNFKSFHLKIHNISGAGAVFGFKQIGEIAFKIEIILEKILLKESFSISSKNKEDIEFLLKELMQSPLTTATPEEKFFQLAEVEEPNKYSSLPPHKLIYLIDDNKVFAQELSLQLKNFGYQVETFYALSDFEEEIQKVSVEAVIMDIKFPEGDLAGPQIISKIKREYNVEFPVLFISSRKDIQARLETIRASGEAYFTKPVDIRNLVDKLEEVISLKEQPPSRVLIVEDNVTLASYYQKKLEAANIQSKIVSKPLEIVEYLKDYQPDLILMDVHMPDCNGLELTKVIRQQEHFNNIPVIFLSTHSDIQKQVLQAGGDDYLVKPVQSQQLIMKISNRICRFQELSKSIRCDSLTGLLNNAAVKFQLELEFEKSLRQKTPLTFSMIDMDHFKKVNDSYGHMAGDLVLKNFSNFLKQHLRRTDVIGRYGGEEFSVIMNITEESALETLNKLRKKFATIKQIVNTQEFFVTISIGISSLPYCKTMDELIIQADKALYRAKNNGRNRIELASKF